MTANALVVISLVVVLGLPAAEDAWPIILAIIAFAGYADYRADKAYRLERQAGDKNDAEGGDDT